MRRPLRTLSKLAPAVLLLACGDAGDELVDRHATPTKTGTLTDDVVASGEPARHDAADADLEEQLAEAKTTGEGSVDVPGETHEDLFQGDILVDEAEETLPSVAGSPTAVKLWPGGVLVYTIAASVKNKQRIADAMKHWEERTGIRFKTRTNEAAYVEFVDGTGCSSFIGRTGRKQAINLAAACTTGSTVHEIGHALGLWHEQSRSDRDQYVKILLQNVTKGMEHNFTKTTFKSSGAYDLGSIMHYGSTYFSANGKPTMTTVDGKVIAANRAVLSTGDIQGIGLIYAKELLPAPKPGATGATTTVNLNLREGPATSFAVLATMPAGSTVARTGKSQNGFDSVTWEGKAGWAYAAYLK